MFTGKVVRVFPAQRYCIVVPLGRRARVLGLREVILSIKDQRAMDETGQIDPEKVRTTIPEIGMIVKFLLDYRGDITPIAFLWAQRPKTNTVKATTQAMSMDGKKPKDMAHNYPRYERYGNSPGEIETTPGKVQQEAKPVPEIAYRSVPDSVKKESSEVSRDAKQETAVVARQEKPIFVRPKPESRRDDCSHSNNGPERKVDGKRRVQDQKSRKEKPKYPTHGRNFRYLERDVGATPIPGKALPKMVSEAPGVPNESQVVQNDPAQVKKTDSVPRSPKVRQESEKGFVMPSWVVDEGVNLVKNGGKVHLGIVGG
jgi:hypothetical protein